MQVDLWPCQSVGMGTGRSRSLSAHPDDESYSTYGTVARYADDPQFRLVVLHATDGEGGEIADGFPNATDSRRLAQTGGRQRLACLGALWPSTRDWLGSLPDGGLEGVGVEVLGGTVVAFLRDGATHVVGTLAPNGVTGHPDHIAMSQATTEAFHIVRQEPGRGSSGYCTAVSHSSLQRGQRWLSERGRPGREPTKTFHLRESHRAVPDRTDDAM